MTQAMFMAKTVNSRPLRGVSQTYDGRVVAQMTAEFEIIHNFKNDDNIEVVFLEDQQRYTLKKDKQLDVILDMYTKFVGKGLTEKLRKYCQANLKISA